MNHCRLRDDPLPVLSNQIKAWIHSLGNGFRRVGSRIWAEP